MKAPVSQESRLRSRIWTSIMAVIAAAALGTWVAREYWQHRQAPRGTTRILEDFRVRSASNEPLDLITGRSNVCEVHGTPMTIGTVPVLYGLVDGSRKNSLAVIATPHAGWSHAGGCIVMSASSARAYLCPDCIARAASVSPEEKAFATDSLNHLPMVTHLSERDPFSPDDASFWRPKAILPPLDLSALNPPGK